MFWPGSPESFFRVAQAGFRLSGSGGGPKYSITAPTSYSKAPKLRDSCIESADRLSQHLRSQSAPKGVGFKVIGCTWSGPAGRERPGPTARRAGPAETAAAQAAPLRPDRASTYNAKQTMTVIITHGNLES